MAQKNIDFGTFPDDPSADPIRDAFQKTQNNFNQLFEATSNASVTSINRTPGAGISVNGPTGNVVVTANIANVSVSSPNLLVGTSLALLANSTVYTDSTSQTLYIVVPDTFSIGNLVTSGNANITGNIVAGNANLGNAVVANYFVGSGNNLSNIQAANISGILPSSNFASYSENANSANTVINNSQPNITSLGTLTSLTVSGSINATDLTVTGNLVGANISGNAATAGTVTVNAQPNITSVGTLTSVLVSGNVTGGNLATSGVLQVTGNANVGNLGVTGLITAVGNITGGNLVSSGNAAITGNILANNITANANLSVLGVANIANLIVTGTLQAGDIGVNSISYGNSIVDISNPNGNVSIHVDGVPDVVLVTSTGMNVAGYLNVTGNANIGNVGATNFVGNVIGGTISGNITTAAQPNVTSLGTLTGLTVNGVTNLGAVSNVRIANGANGTYLRTDGNSNLNWVPLVDTPPGGIAGSILYNEANINYQGSSNLTYDASNSIISLAGSLTATGNISASLLTGTLTSSSQPNVKVLGTLDYLIVSTTGYIAAGNANITAGNVYANSGTIGASALNVSGVSNLGNVGNVRILGGSAGQYLQTNGSGNLVWAAAGNATSLVNGTSNIDIPAANGNVNTSVGGNANVFVVTGTGANINGYLNVSSNANAGNIGTSGLISATGNITGGNLVTAGVLNASGNSQSNIGGNLVVGVGSGGSITGANLVSANFFTGTLTSGPQPNITSVGTLTSLSISGNANVGNLGVTGVFATTLSATGNANVGNLGVTGVFATTLSATGNANVGNLGVTGVFATTLSATGNANVGNLGTAGLIIATGNITGGNLVTAGVLNVSGTGQSNIGGNLRLGNGSGGSLSGANSISANFFTGTLTTGSQPNITAIGTLTSLSVSGNANIGNIGTAGLISVTGNITGANIVASNYNIRSVTTGITANGTTQGSATALTKEINIVSTVTAGANGVVLPTGVAGMVIYIRNATSDTLNVFPASGAAIDTLSANTSYSQSANTTVEFIAPTATQWYTV